MGDLWHGMKSRKSHVREFKNWMPRHSKKPSVRVELRAGGDRRSSEKPRWSASEIKTQCHILTVNLNLILVQHL